MTACDCISVGGIERQRYWALERECLETIGFTNRDKRFASILEWRAPLSHCGRIIPFCTPLSFKAPAMVIGTNHTDFDKSPEVANEIANRFATALPTENTYMVHNHRFAVRLRQCTCDAGIEVTEQWIGTNRCAVQSEAGITALRREPAFRACQREMDELLRVIIDKLLPVNVLLFGEHAKRLYFRRGENATSKRINDGQTKLIPIPHLSFRRSPSEIVNILRDEFVSGSPK